MTMEETEITESEHIQKWKNPQVLSYLEASGMAELIDRFRTHNITGKDLLSLTEKELKEDLSITNIHMRKKVSRQISRLRKIAGMNTCMVRVMYFSKEAVFKIFSIESFTLHDLLADCVQCYQIPSDKGLVFKDAAEHVIPLSTKMCALVEEEAQLIELFLTQTNYLSSTSPVQEQQKPLSRNEEYNSKKLMKAQTTTKAPLTSYLKPESIRIETGEYSVGTIENRSRNNERPYQSTTQLKGEYPFKNLFASSDAPIAASPKFPKPVVPDPSGTGADTMSFNPENQSKQLLSKETEELLAACRKRMQKVKDRLESQTPKSPSTTDKRITGGRYGLGYLSARGLGGREGARTTVGKKSQNI